MSERHSSTNWTGRQTTSVYPESTRSQEWSPRGASEQTEGKHAELADSRHSGARDPTPSSSPDVEYTHPPTPDLFESDSESPVFSHLEDMGAMSNDDHASNGSSRNGRVGFIRGVASGGRAHTGQAADDRPPPRKLSMESLAAAELIGRGGFGHVYRGRHTDTGKVLAIKLIPRSDKAQRVKDSLWREREVGVCISEAKARVGGQAGSSAILGLLHLLGAFLTPECIVLVTELCVTDMAAIRCLDEDDLRFYFGELICGVRYLHDELGYVHRDLKPSNILLTRDGHAQIADFGLVESISNVNYEPKPLRPGRDHFRGVGTLGYIPPEAHLLGVQGPEGDVWALGVILFRLATGIHPFRQKGDDEDTVVGNVAHRPLTMSSTENLSINSIC
ncbi:SubName: Full=Uncharacterized protein {ECO:0000313/EMBL:CCA75869.1} [Serendipita indica DSM 11827]|nr:SubName: Full=Uncharacterized protein {ECO:0000313/EMBL:CCA75869.1} [Serendipita indica DSM 11827]